MPGSTMVRVREVGLRDGLQAIPTVRLSTEQKLEWIKQAYEAGQTELEVGSFVPAKYLPQLADTAELVAYAKQFPGLVASVLIPNFRGAERALEVGADVMVIPLSASHSHSLANLKKTPDEVVSEVSRVRALRDSSGASTLIEGGVGTAFGCTIQGLVPEEEVLRLMQALLDAGADRVSLADTVGYADPAMVKRLFEKALRLVGDRLCCAHFHDTRGLGMANVFAAYEMGITRFDACLAGTGGCPHAPGATGNVATEDVVYLFKSLGVETGQDFDKLMQLRNKVASWLEGELLGGSIARAGLPKTLRGPANLLAPSAS